MKKQNGIILLTIILLGTAIFWWAKRLPPDRVLAGRTKVRLQLQWLPQAQFIGFYVAEAKNFYAEEGLSVEMKHGGPEIIPLKKLATDESDIALATADQVLVWQSENKDQTGSLKAVGTVFNRNLAVFISPTVSNIRTPSDLKGKTVGVYPSYDTENILLAMLKKHGVPASDVKLRPFPNVQEFIAGRPGAVEVLGSYLINEPLLAKQSGLDVYPLDPESFGIKFYSDTVITTEAYLSQNRETVRRFLKASSRGWEYARNNPSEALRLMYSVVGASIGKGEPERHQEQMLAEVLRNIGLGPEKRVFEMEKSRWEEMARWLHEIGRVKNSNVYVDVCDFGIFNEIQSK